MRKTALIATAFASLWLAACGGADKPAQPAAETPEPIATASVEYTTTTEVSAPPRADAAAQPDPAAAQEAPAPGNVDTVAPSVERTTEPVAMIPAPAYAAPRAFAKPDVERKEPLIKVESREMGKGDVQTGLDVLKKKDFEPLKGKTVALLTNHSAIDREGNHALDLMVGHPNVKIVKLFSPEHGLYGDVDTKTPDMQDTATGLMVHSLYTTKPDDPKKPHHPRAATLEGVDLVIVDMQDIGARYYTYCSYMAYMMEVCAKLDIEVMVLDRPNPVGGVYVDGPIIDEDLEGMVTGYFRMPIAHGMTMGEMALMFNAENKINCKLSVVECENWTRDMFFDETGLRWVNPSPNIQDLEAALVYTGIAIPESQVSMGRGTSEPFHVFGAPYIRDAQELVDELTSGGLPGMRLEAADFTPTGTLSRGHVGEGRLCRGARMHITDRKTMRPVLLGIRLVDYLQRTYGDELIEEMRWNASERKSLPTGRKVPRFDVMRLRGSSSAVVCARIREGKPVDETMKFIDEQVARFMPVRAKYLLYTEGK